MFWQVTLASVNSAKVASVGEALIVLVPTEPGPLESAGAFERGVGGAELNVAVGLATLGTSSALVSRVGDDGFGRRIVAELGRHGVDTAGIDVDRARRTGLYVKEVGGSSGSATDLGPGVSRMHYYRQGSAGSALSPSLLERGEGRRILDAAALVHTTGITPALSNSACDLSFALAEQPRSEGRLLSFDLNWRDALWAGREAEGRSVLRELADLADIVLVGASEAVTVFGTADPGALREAVSGPRILVVKNDGNAATAFDGPRRVDVPANEAEVVEAIGAGDAFAAGLVDALVRRAPVDEAVARAHSVAVQALSSHADHVGRP